tara:strand:+ start:1729 stop:2382 length:654 start_codon:yes stop_codon:yes gene_type:complete
MDIYIDTANLEEIKNAVDMGIIDGCTTNPAIVAKEGCEFESRMKEILALVKGPVSIEVTTIDVDTMVEEAVKYSKWGDNVVVKIPMDANGLRATKILTEKGIKTNVTCCMSSTQAVLAAKAGATYVSLFYGRIADMGYDAMYELADAVNIFEHSGFESKIIAGSLRSVADVMTAIRAGVHIVTVPPASLNKMYVHPRTKETIQEFLDFWADYKKKHK